MITLIWQIYYFLPRTNSPFQPSSNYYSSFQEQLKCHLFYETFSELTFHGWVFIYFSISWPLIILQCSLDHQFYKIRTWPYVSLSPQMSTNKCQCWIRGLRFSLTSITNTDKLFSQFLPSSKNSVLTHCTSLLHVRVDLCLYRLNI